MPIPRSEQARINAARSRGPEAAEGKPRPALDAVKHGRCAVNDIVLTKKEDAEALEELVASYARRIQPRDQLEYRLTRELAAIDWRLIRTCALQTSLLDREMDIFGALDESRPGTSKPTRVLNAGRSTVGRSSHPSHLSDYTVHLRHARQATIAFLLDLREHFPQSEDHPVIIPPQTLNPDLPHQSRAATPPSCMPVPLSEASESGPSASLEPSDSITGAHAILSCGDLSSEAIEAEDLGRQNQHRNEPKTNPTVDRPRP